MFVMSRRLASHTHAFYYTPFKKAPESDLINTSNFFPLCIYISVCYEDMVIIPLAYIQKQPFEMFFSFACCICKTELEAVWIECCML